MLAAKHNSHHFGGEIPKEISLTSCVQFSRKEKEKNWLITGGLWAAMSGRVGAFYRTCCASPFVVINMPIEK